MKKRILPVILAAVILIGALAVTAYALTTVSSQTALVTAFKKGGDIKISKSITLTQGLVVAEGKAVTLDLNGKTLDRALSVVQTEGSVITVMPGGKFTLRDSSGTNDGIIKGGAALNGGGICNYGEVLIEAGTIMGNKALNSYYGCGGGIYNGMYENEPAVLTIKGGVISHNSARNGGGIYNSTGCTVTVQEGSYIKTVGNLSKTIVDNVKITENTAADFGCGIFNAGEFYISGSPTFSGNESNGSPVDIYCAAGKHLTLNGKLSLSEKVTLQGCGEDPEIIRNYNKYNTASPKDLFRAAVKGESLILGTSGEIRIKNTSDTIVQVYSKNKLVKSETYEDPGTAWDAAVKYAETYQRAEILLGSDYSHDRQLIIYKDRNVTLDLNGHYVCRTRNGSMKNDGEVFYVGENATFTVLDSNPDSRGYDGVEGGVIAGGASGNGAGGVHVSNNATFNMFGGTIYKCITDEDGGGIYLKSNSKLNMKDCRIYFCQTIDSFDECHGGGIYAEKVSCTINLENVTFQDCYSEDDGGALYINDYDGNAKVDCTVKNCLFIGNKCENFGGAVYIFGYNTESTYKFIDCTFRNNKCYDNGGGLYINGGGIKGQNPILIEGCIINSNNASDYGSGLFAGRNGVVIMDSTITDNSAGSSGAVYVHENHTISLAGKVIIKDNTAEYNGANLNLDDTNSIEKNTLFACAGLTEGSEVYFYRGDRGGVPVAKNIPEYQLKYFHPEHGTMKFIEEGEVETPVVTASLFSNGSALILGILGAAAAAAVIIAVIVKKRKGGVTADV